MSPFLADQQLNAGADAPLTLQLTADHFNSLEVMNFLCAYLGAERERAPDVARQVATAVREDDTLAMVIEYTKYYLN